MTTPDPKIVASLLRQLADQFDPPFVPYTETITMVPKLEHVEVHEDVMRPYIDDTLLTVLRAYAEDAPNWGGMPLMGEGSTVNVPLDEAHDDALARLVNLGFVAYHDEPAANGGRGTDRFLVFTEDGAAYIKTVFNIDVE